MPTPREPDSQFARVLKALQEFLQLEAAGGLALIFAAALAMLVANSPASSAYHHLIEFPLRVKFDPYGITLSLHHWINDGLMSMFFLLVGMELKREIVEGHLSSLQRVSLPAFAALGGMAAPALIYALINRGHPAALRLWAAPTATDIAFALGVLALLGDRVPTALKTFLLSVAIFDDLGAIVIIALFYSSGLAWAPIVVALAVCAALWVANRRGVRKIHVYLALGIPLWIAVFQSGLHATLAGVILSMFIPLNRSTATGEATDEEPLLPKLEHALHPWVAFGVLPLFAFTNAGIPLQGLTIRDTFHPVPLGIALGLFVGKQVGILAASWAATKLRLAALPEAVTWRQLHGIAILCGIGFTMSFFIASLAFGEGEHSPFHGVERIGIMVGTLVSGVVGYMALKSCLPSGRQVKEGDEV